MRRIFISHAFRHVADYQRLVDRLEAHGIKVYNHSIPFWNQVDAEGSDLADAIERKMRGCQAVLVLVTPGIHKSDWIRYELELAERLGKRVIGVWRHGEKELVPIPDHLDRQLYRMVGWNGPALIRAIDGQYPPDAKIYDIAEETDRQRLAQTLLAGVAVGTLVLVGTRDLWIPLLNKLLRPRGVSVQIEPVPDGPGVLGPALVGTLLGSLLACFTDKPEKSMAGFATTGAALGTLYGVARSYRLRVVRGGRAVVHDVVFEEAD